jgi:hypothetical protein
MNTVQTLGFMGLLAASSVVVGTTTANAASLAIGSTVSGANVFSGPTFTVNNDFLGSDLISLTVTGTVDLFNTDPQGYVTNAAGVLAQTSSVGSVGSTGVNPADGSNFGSLLLGNSSLGYKQLFAANGNPATTLSFSNISLASLFGSGLANGTVLEFRVSDSNTADNSGSFNVSGSISQAADVPEPFTIIGSLVGGTAALRMRKKLKSDKI